MKRIKCSLHNYNVFPYVIKYDNHFTSRAYIQFDAYGNILILGYILESLRLKVVVPDGINDISPNIF